MVSRSAPEDSSELPGLGADAGSSPLPASREPPAPEPPEDARPFCPLFEEAPAAVFIKLLVPYWVSSASRRGASPTFLEPGPSSSDSPAPAALSPPSMYGDSSALAADN